MSNGRDLDPVEYARLIVDTVQQDIARTHVRVVASLAIVGVFLTKLKDVRTLDHAWEVPKFGGIGLLVVAALSYFQYTQELNKARIAIVRDLPSEYTCAKDELERVRTPWDPFIREPIQLPLVGGRRFSYHLGQGSFLLGSAALAVVLLKLVA